MLFSGLWADKQAGHGESNRSITGNGKCKRRNQAALLQKHVSVLPNGVLSFDGWKPAATSAVYLHSLWGKENHRWSFVVVQTYVNAAFYFTLSPDQTNTVRSREWLCLWHFFLCSFNVRLNVVVSTVYKKKHCKIKIFICAFIFKCLGESFMALWAVYHLLYPENNLELIPNIVCMFVLGVY